MRRSLKKFAARLRLFRLICSAAALLPQAASGQATPVATAAAPNAPAPAPEKDPVGDRRPVSRDWRWIQGAVFVPTNAVNEAQQWDEYDAAINDRELHYASVYGINCVRVFLHYAIYEKKKDALLGEIEDFLTRANKYQIKVDFVFFDSCWNNPPSDLLSPHYVYPAPVYGTHNSRWLKGPSNENLQHYPADRETLKSYVQDIVAAHMNDSRIAFWETFNEPNSHSAPVTRLMADAVRWIHETGTPIPVTATGGENYKGDAYGDFSSWHQYDADSKLRREPITSLCTECMERDSQTVPSVIGHFKGKVGFIMWELGIGRDNCRFRWDQSGKNAAKKENAVPFHGIVYPDGHPWSVDDVRALLGPDAFAKAPLFKVQYFLDSTFTKAGKESVTPMIDFNLNDEKGTNVPDSSIGMPDTNWSVRWTGMIGVPQSGAYTFTVDGDNAVRVLVNGRKLIDKTRPERAVASGTATLVGGSKVPVEIDYVHARGVASLHLDWSGPGVEEQALTPVR